MTRPAQAPGAAAPGTSSVRSGPGAPSARSGSGALERPLWWALGVYRLLALGYAVLRYSWGWGAYVYPAGGWAYMALLVVWTLGTLPLFRTPGRCGWWLLSTDLVLGAGGVLLTPLLADTEAVRAGLITLPTVWSASAVLGFAIKGGWRWGAAAALAVGCANVLERGRLVENVLHNAVLLMLAGVAIGYVVTLARTGERALSRALRIEAATRERERLARDIHDGVLQVLAMVQRRGLEAGGEAAELGRLAGEQEAALRTLIAGRPDAEPARAAARAAAAEPAAGADEAVSGGAAAAEPAAGDVAALLTGLAGPYTTVSTPGAAVPLPRRAAAELTAAVGAALDNVRLHAGEGARAWVLVEDEPDAVVVSVRDDGPGIPAGRLERAEAEGRLGFAQSIRGRVADLGGEVRVVAPPGQGTELELRVPRC